MKKNHHLTQPQNGSTEQQVLTYLEKNTGVTVDSLFKTLKAKLPALTEAEITDLVWRLAEEDRVNLEDIPPALNSMREYIRLWDRNLWFYLSVATSLLTVLVASEIPTDSPLVIVRWILGAVFMVFIPGYVTVEALFPKGREIGEIERFALSFGLSLALVPLIALLLNYTPWGIRLTPILLSLTLFTVGVAIVGVVRRFKLAQERFELEQLP
jgi:hypothetical protein